MRRVAFWLSNVASGILLLTWIGVCLVRRRIVGLDS